ncbi:MAG: DoxX family protein [Candidatus Krumholzibacteriia bacterium]
MWSVGRVVSSRPVNVDIGLLIVRLGVGFSIAVFHGYGKITGGPDLWTGIGSHMSNLGITFAPAVWGFMAASAEFFGSILLILGVLFRPAAAFLAFVMFVAALRHLNLPADSPVAGWKGASHALELLAVYVALFFTGPGRYASRLILKPQREP